jgi:photosystem II stability/assembly factor-like uncharacterized protein
MSLSGCFKVQKTPPPKLPYRFVTPSHLFAVATPDRDNVWVAGFDGAIAHSSDSGKTWEHQSSGMKVNLCDVSFVNTRSGWISGRAGVMLHTEDGGKTWVKQDTGTANHLFAVSFVDEQYGWAAGDFGIIMHTVDGGRTWAQQGSGEDKIYNDICFVDRSSGWVVGEYGVIYATADGGATWQKQECKEIIPVVIESEWETFPPSLYGVYFSSTRDGFACGMDGTIISTADGGVTWRKIHNPAEATKITLYKIKGSGANRIAVGQKGKCVFSEDSGSTWKMRERSTNTKFWIRDLDVAGELQAWAVGSRGTILKTDDGAKSWNIVSGIALDLKAE